MAAATGMKERLPRTISVVPCSGPARRPACAPLCGLLLSACAREAPLELPPLQGASALVLALLGPGEPRLFALEAAGEGAVPVALQAARERLVLLAYPESLAALGLAPGPVEVVAPGPGGLPLPPGPRVWEAQLGAPALGWVEAGEVPLPLRELQVRRQPAEPPCLEVAVRPVTFPPASLPLDWLWSAHGLDARRALLFGRDRRVFRVEGGVAELLVDFPPARTGTITVAATAGDHTYFALGSGELLRAPVAELGVLETVRTATSDPIISLTAAPPGAPPELWAATLEGTIFEWSDGQLRRRWREGTPNVVRRLFWAGPGLVLHVDGSSCLRELRAGELHSGACAPVTADDQALRFVGAAHLPELGPVLGAVVQAGLLIGSGALFVRRGGAWAPLADYPYEGYPIQPTAFAAHAGGLLFGARFSLLGQYHPARSRPCGLQRLEEQAVIPSRIIPLEGGWLLQAAVEREAEGFAGAVLWLEEVGR